MEIKLILEDTRNKPKSHDLKNEYFKAQGIKVERTKLYTGDYTLATNQSVCIDTKADILELYSNITSDHERFKAEAIRAQEAGIKLVVLIENKDGVTKLSELDKWKNPMWKRYNFRKRQAERQGVEFKQKPPLNNGTIKKIMWTMQEKYGIEWVFCTPEEAGARIIEILRNGKEER